LPERSLRWPKNNLPANWARRELAASFDVNHRRMRGMVGVEAGYSYAGSTLITDEPGNVAE
jgi:hypothetical protein